ncbi:unnamed protein product [Leuciscus chuanchicus]
MARLMKFEAPGREGREFDNQAVGWKLLVKRDDIMRLLQELNPQRTRRRFVRRTYHSMGPNYLWHVDGYDFLPSGFARIIIGLIHTLDLCKAQNINTVHVQSSTSLPQQWHKPRGAKVAPQPVTAVVVARAKKERKQRPIFCQYSNDRATSEVTDQDLLLLRELTGTPMSYIASKPPIDVVIGQEKYPLGSGLSYQVKQM